MLYNAENIYICNDNVCWYTIHQYRDGRFQNSQSDVPSCCQSRNARASLNTVQPSPPRRPPSSRRRPNLSCARQASPTVAQHHPLAPYRSPGLRRFVCLATPHSPSLAGQFAAARLSVWNNKWSQIFNFTGGDEDWSCLPQGSHHR